MQSLISKVEWGPCAIKDFSRVGKIKFPNGRGAVLTETIKSFSDDVRFSIVPTFDGHFDERYEHNYDDLTFLEAEEILRSICGG